MVTKAEIVRVLIGRGSANWCSDLEVPGRDADALAARIEAEGIAPDPAVEVPCPESAGELTIQAERRGDYVHAFITAKIDRDSDDLSPTRPTFLDAVGLAIYPAVVGRDGSRSLLCR